MSIEHSKDNAGAVEASEVLDIEQGVPMEEQSHGDSLEEAGGVSRRRFLQWMGLGAGISAVGGGIALREFLKQPEPGPSLYKLKNKENFPGKEWAVLANTPTFEKVGKAFAESHEGKEFLGKRDKITILYPGAGVHLATLGAVKTMLEGTPNLKEVELIYTEIDPSAYASIDVHLKTIVDKSPYFSNFKVEEKVFKPGEKESPKQKKMSFDFQRPDGTKVKIEIVFEFKRSGEAYYLPEHFNRADILIEHDLTPKGHDSPFDAMKMYISSFDSHDPKKQKAMFGTYQRARVNGQIARLTMDDKIGKVVAKADGSWGCGPNHWDTKPGRRPVFQHAAASMLDVEFLNKIASNKKITEDMIFLLNFAQSSDPSMERKVSTASCGEGEKIDPKVEAMKAIENILLFLEDSNDKKFNDKIVGVLLTFMTERFFYAPLERFPLLQKALRKYAVAHPNEIDIEDFNTESDVVNFMNLRDHTSKMDWRKTRALIMLELAGNQDSPEKKVIAAKLKEVINQEIDNWLNSPQLQQVLAVFADNTPNVLLSYGAKHGIKTMPQENATIGSIDHKNSHKGLFRTTAVDKTNYQGGHPAAWLFISITNNVFEYFMSIAYIAKQLGCENFKKICSRVDGSNPPDGTFAKEIQNLCHQ